MKKLISLFSVLVSFSAFAGPKVGDTSVLTGTVQQFGANQVSMKSSITAIDAAAGQATVLRQLIQNGVVLGSETEAAALDELNVDEIDQVVQNCSMFGGTRQTLSVKAGNFDTCRMGDANNDVYLAKVPFMAVKVVQRDASGKTVTDLELESFAFGK